MQKKSSAQERSQNKGVRWSCSINGFSIFKHYYTLYDIIRTVDSILILTFSQWADELRSKS